MERWMAALAALAFTNGGCAGRVIDPGPETRATAPTALAMRLGSVPASEATSPPFTPDMAPGSLVLFFSPDGQTCSQPVLPQFFTGAEAPAPPCDATNPRWQTIVVIPPELAQPGVVDLRDPRISEYAQEVLEGCGFGSRVGSGVTSSGTLDIVSSDASSVRLTLSGDVKAMATVIDGDYTAQRCDAP